MRPKSKQNRKLTHTIFLQREHQLGHHSYDEEMRQYEYIKQGNMLGIEESKDMFTSSKTGVLSDDPLRSTKYLFVASMTLVTRFCIEGGMEAETAYTLSDLYIQQADQCTSVTAVETLHTEMVTGPDPAYGRPSEESCTVQGHSALYGFHLLQSSYINYCKGTGRAFGALPVIPITPIQKGNWLLHIRIHSQKTCRSS